MAYLIREKKKRRSSKDVGLELKISRRRVDQVWEEYRDTGKVPVIGENVGRPRKPRTGEEKEVVRSYRARDEVEKAIDSSQV